jgi:Spy/CpxP family protein refolding chaperone
MSARAQTQAPLTQTTYFTYRVQHLNDALQLTPAQANQIKHVIEQESGMLNEIVCNLASSRKHQLQQFEEILRDSDESMKPILTAEQNQKLPQLRQDEMRNLESVKPPSTCTDAYWKLGEPAN